MRALLEQRRTFTASPGATVDKGSYKYVVGVKTETVESQISSSRLLRYLQKLGFNAVCNGAVKLRVARRERRVRPK
jgi:phosphosulfolactate synthase (CoM biosynthesis protein A)